MLCESTLRGKLSGSRQSSFLAAKNPRVFGVSTKTRPPGFDSVGRKPGKGRKRHLSTAKRQQAAETAPIAGRSTSAIAIRAGQIENSATRQAKRRVGMPKSPAPLRVVRPAQPCRIVRSHGRKKLSCTRGCEICNSKKPCGPPPQDGVSKAAGEWIGRPA